MTCPGEKSRNAVFDAWARREYEVQAARRREFEWKIRQGNARAQTERAIAITRAYFRRLNREGVALDMSGRLASNRDKAEIAAATATRPPRRGLLFRPRFVSGHEL